MCLVAALAAGCGPVRRQRILSFFFDGVGTAPNPPTVRLRRDLVREIDELKRHVEQLQRHTGPERAGSPVSEPPPPAVPAETAHTWEEAAALLPKDASGQVDWEAALSSGAIVPRATLTPEEPSPALFDLEVEVQGTERAAFRSAFSHGTHGRWLSCQGCHPALFPVARRAPPAVVTMAKIRQGRFCGACHGTVAFGTQHACSRCHRAMPARAAWTPAAPSEKPIEFLHRWEEAQRMLSGSDGEPDWTKALVSGVIAPRTAIGPETAEPPAFVSDVTRVPDGMPEMAAFFPHSAHTAWLKCESCHPNPFQMQGGATAMSMDQINAGEFCGACHGTVAFPLSACAKCHPAMEAGP